MGMMTRRNVKQRAVKKTAPFVEEVKNDDFSQFMNPPVEDNATKYTKTEINRMSTAELKELATNEKIIGAENMTGADLKIELIKHFNL